jgi:hypothetical protein
MCSEGKYTIIYFKKLFDILKSASVGIGEVLEDKIKQNNIYNIKYKVKNIVMPCNSKIRVQKCVIKFSPQRARKHLRGEGGFRRYKLPRNVKETSSAMCRTFRPLFGALYLVACAIC